MSAKQNKTRLRNHLDESFRMSDEEYEQLRMEYENDKGTHPGVRSGTRLAIYAGVVLVLLALLTIVQQLYFPYGPDLTRIIRMVPAAGSLLVLFVGLGLLARVRNRKKSRSPGEGRRESVNPEMADETSDSHEQASQAETQTSQSASSDSKARYRDQSESYSGSGEHHRQEYHAWKNRKRWYRSRSEKMLFGVCGGIAERYQIDPTIVRALFALAFFSYGFSFVIYIVLAVVLPRKPAGVF